MTPEALKRIQEQIATARTSLNVLVDDIETAVKAGIPIADLQARASALRARIEQMEAVYSPPESHESGD